MVPFRVDKILSSCARSGCGYPAVGDLKIDPRYTDETTLPYLEGRLCERHLQQAVNDCLNYLHPTEGV